jgi:hypothetical protein
MVTAILIAVAVLFGFFAGTIFGYRLRVEISERARGGDVVYDRDRGYVDPFYRELSHHPQPPQDIPSDIRPHQ